MGRNGAGKTTLLRCDRRRARTDPRRRSRSTARAPTPGVDVALCPQEPESVLFAETVADEVRATLQRPAICPTTRCRSSTRSASRISPPGIRATSRPGSGCCVATAAIAAAGAPVLLLDEPTRGLDPASKDRLARFLRSHAAGGGAAVLATHDVELAAAVADARRDARGRRGRSPTATPASCWATPRLRAADDARVRRPGGSRRSRSRRRWHDHRGTRPVTSPAATPRPLRASAERSPVGPDFAS